MSKIMPFETLLVDYSREGVLTVTINRPTVLNALNAQVFDELNSVLDDVLSSDYRVLVLKGSGTKAFVAGADIGGFSEMSPEDALYFSREGQMFISTLEKLPQITVACVQGYALGGGLELVLGCDIVVASEKALFGQPEVNLGLIPGFGGTQRLVKRVGLPVAMDLLCTGKGRNLGATEAFQLGLVSRVVPEKDFAQEIEKVIQGILNAGPTAVSEVKRLCRQAMEMTLDAGLSSEASAFANCFTRDEMHEGVQAFLEKRAPKFVN